MKIYGSNQLTIIEKRFSNIDKLITTNIHDEDSLGEKGSIGNMRNYTSVYVGPSIEISPCSTLTLLDNRLM